MIIVHGQIPIKASEKRRAIGLMRRMAMESREENGCLVYEFYVNLENPNLIMLYQEWQDADSIEAHFSAPHMGQFLTQLPNVLDGEIVTRRYEVESGTTMEHSLAEEEVELEIMPKNVTLH